MGCTIYRFPALTWPPALLPDLCDANEIPDWKPCVFLRSGPFMPKLTPTTADNTL